MKDHNGKQYEQVAEMDRFSCEGCAGLPQGSDLCVELRDVGGGSCENKIWEEVEMKSALEIAEKLIESNKGYSILPELKAAIEREQASAITMRPIAELPDRVPEGCAVVQVNANGWLKGSSFPGGDLTVCDGATGFYILPLPVAERKLKPCPWCGARPFQHNYCHWVVMHSISCAIEGSSIICKGKENAESEASQ